MPIVPHLTIHRASPVQKYTFTGYTHGCVCSDTLPVLVHLKTTRGLYGQLSVVCLGTGNARLVDQDEPGFERLSSTSISTISASTRRGSVRRNAPSGVNSWRRLCPVKDAPLDDDDDDDGIITSHHIETTYAGLDSLCI